jgi:hypothetical protein
MLMKVLAWSTLVTTLLFAGVSLAGVFGGSALGGMAPSLILGGVILAGVAALVAGVMLILGAFQS